MISAPMHNRNRSGIVSLSDSVSKTNVYNDHLAYFILTTHPQNHKDPQCRQSNGTSCKQQSILACHLYKPNQPAICP